MTLSLKLLTCIKHTCMRACMLDMKGYEEEIKVHRVHETFLGHRVARLRLSNTTVTAQCIYTGNTITGSHRRGFVLFSVTHSHTAASVKIHNRISRAIMNRDRAQDAFTKNKNFALKCLILPSLTNSLFLSFCLFSKK